MMRQVRVARRTLGAIGAVTLLVAGSPAVSWGQDVKVTLSGAQEVPPVTTSASGSGTIKVAADKSVSGSVKTAGVTGTAAHIHQGEPGQNGPVIIPLTKAGDNEWSVPAGTKLTDEQSAAFKAGKLYINVHSAAHKGGEIRGQLKP